MSAFFYNGDPWQAMTWNHNHLPSTLETITNGEVRP